LGSGIDPSARAVAVFRARKPTTASIGVIMVFLISTVSFSFVGLSSELVGSKGQDENSIAPRTGTLKLI
jgi:hypothetical protein